MTFKIKRGDLEPPLEISCTRDGTSVDLTNADSVHVVLAHSVSGETPVRREASGTADGKVVMAWQAEDTDVVGIINVEVEVTWPGGRPETFPDDDYLAVEVVPDLG